MQQPLANRTGSKFNTTSIQLSNRKTLASLHQISNVFFFVTVAGNSTACG